MTESWKYSTIHNACGKPLTAFLTAGTHPEFCRSDGKEIPSRKLRETAREDPGRKDCAFFIPSAGRRRGCIIFRKRGENCMETRVAVLAIIVKESASVAALNDCLRQ